MKTENYNELIELIELAEKVADKTEFYKIKLFNLRLLTIVFTIVSFGLFFLFTILILDFNPKMDSIRSSILVVSLLAAILYIFVLFRQTSRFRKYYYHERKTLARLLEMTNEFKLLAFNSSNLTVIEKAMVEMRLSRINFNE